MPDSTLAVIQALSTHLKSQPTLTPFLTDRVYTAIPEKAAFPCLLIDIASPPYETTTTQGMNHEVRLTIFSRTHGAKEALDLRALTHDSVHNNTLNLTGFHCINMRVVGPNSTQLMRDGATWRSTVRLSIKVTH